jgi:2-dehydro-3-deoxygluconokinase
MDTYLDIPQQGSLDLLYLGALVHRVDPGNIPFRKSTQWAVHVSGGEFNVAANLADCFGCARASRPQWRIIHWRFDC